jgi:hypothetical protein
MTAVDARMPLDAALELTNCSLINILIEFLHCNVMSGACE